jgi:tetratricopeptide (TPR) repeat protein
MTGQTIRWALAFAATAAIAAAITVAAANAPPAETGVPTRDPAGVSPVELELILNKIREGDLLAMKMDEKGAERAWREARRRGEGLWPIHEGLGDSFSRAKLFAAALGEYRLAEDRVPEKLASAKLGIAAKRAGALAALGRPLEAIQTYLDLNQINTFGSRIFNLALEGDPVAAIRLMERHAEIQDPRVFKLVAGLYRSLDRNVDAAEALAKFAQRLEPWNEVLNRQVLQNLRESKHYDSALEVGRAWARAVPDSADAYQAIGDVLWDAGRKPEAWVAYSSIVDLHPADVAARWQLGEIYFRRERPEEAQAQFEAGLRLQPENSELRVRVVDYSRARLSELEKEGRGDDVLKLRRKLGQLNVQDLGLFDIKVVMTWDAASDVDLDVLEPDGTRINHANRVSKVGGVYLTDNTKGYGPETYTLGQATSGIWRVGAHLHSGMKSKVKFVTLVFEGTPKEERHEDTVVLERSGDSPVFVREIVIP